jgi:protein-S-isoprenylcysteine O-methyltransferase Ste14
MPIHAYLVEGLFIIMGLSLFVVVIGIKNGGNSFLGKPTIGKLEFYTGKIALFTGWGFFLYKSIHFNGAGYDVPPALAWSAVVLLALATLLLIISFHKLGKALKVGLPDEETRLQTSGIYSFSRNPLYVGVFAVCIASCLYYPNPVNILLTAYGMLIHYRITLGEERFLAKRFGKEWEEYKTKVRRFL